MVVQRAVAPIATLPRGPSRGDRRALSLFFPIRSRGCFSRKEREREGDLVCSLKRAAAPHNTQPLRAPRLGRVPARPRLALLSVPTYSESTQGRFGSNFDTTKWSRDRGRYISRASRNARVAVTAAVLRRLSIVTKFSEPTGDETFGTSQGRNTQISILKCGAGFSRGTAQKPPRSTPA